MDRFNDSAERADDTRGDVRTDGVLANYEQIDALVREHQDRESARQRVLWSYYRNPVQPQWWEHAARTLEARAGTADGARAVRLAQERSLPARFWGNGKIRPSWETEAGKTGRKEIVIENDIAWRIHAMVDFLFNRPIRLTSTASDRVLASMIDRALDAAWEASGGMGLLQDAALLAAVYGHVDLLVRILPSDHTSRVERDEGDGNEDGGGAQLSDDDRLLEAARRIRVEVVSPTRGVPSLSDADYRQLDGYCVRVRRGVPAGAVGSAGSSGAGSGAAAAGGGLGSRSTHEGDALIVTEVFTAGRRRVFTQVTDASGHAVGATSLVEDESLEAWPNRVPVVHVQNISQPLSYAGLSEVEPLIPLQDELNTRLSDRANRVTLQSFKMYLAKGIEGFDQGAVGPGVVWTTDNDLAKIEAFGGDSASPSEESHIDEIREALDKTSGVPPLATGVVRAKIGNLTSENALRIVLQGLLTRTARKRVAWTRGIAEVCRLMLAALDHAGVLRTRESQRGVNVEWADALPRDLADELKTAQAKSELGVQQDRVLSDLGIGRGQRGVE